MAHNVMTISFSRASIEWLATVLFALMVAWVYTPSLSTLAGLLGAGIAIPVLLKKPEYGLFFLVTILPLREFYLLSVISLQRAAIWGLFFYALIRQVMGTNRLSSAHFPMFNKLMLAFITAMLASLIKTASALNSSFYFNMEFLKMTIFSDALIVIENILLLYIVYYFLQTLDHIQRLIDVILAVSAGILLLGIIQYARGGTPAFARSIAVPDTLFYGRATAVFASPNTFGHFAVAIGLIAFVSLIWGKQPRLKRLGFTLPACLLGGIGLILSFSRSAVLTLCASIFMMAYLYYVHICRWKIRWQLLLIVAIIGGVIFAIMQYYDVFLRTRLAMYKDKDYQTAVQWIKTQSDYGRKYAMLKATQTFLEHPVLGIGYNAFSASKLAFGLTTHSQYLKILAEMGLFGFIPFIMIWGMIVRMGLNLLKPSQKANTGLRQEKLLSFMLLTGFATIALTSLSVDDLHIRAIAGNLWMFSGAIFSIDRLKSSVISNT